MYKYIYIYIHIYIYIYIYNLFSEGLVSEAAVVFEAYIYICICVYV